MKKETEKAEESSSLEEKIKLSARDACGSFVRTFDCINDLENVSEIRKDNPGADGSGFIRADVMNSFLLSINELIGNCEMHFAIHENPNLAMLRYFEPEKDRFLQLLNEKKFDGICDSADNIVRQKQYRQIKEAYFTDRESVVNGMYIQHLKKGRQKKRRWLSHIIGMPIAAFLLAGAAAQIATYFTAKALKEETRSTVSRLEESMQPENMIRRAEDYFKSKSGQEYINSKYSEFKDWWVHENLAADQLDLFWEKKVLPALTDMNSAEYDQRRAAQIVTEFKKEYPELEKAAETLAKMFGSKNK